MFVYVCRIIPNELPKHKQKKSTILTFIYILIILPTINHDAKTNLINLDIFTKILDRIFCLTLLGVILYLLLVLIVVIRNIFLLRGPIRTKKKLMITLRKYNPLIKILNNSLVDLPTPINISV